MKNFIELQELYKADFESNKSSLKEYEEAKRYYHGSQLQDDIIALMKARGQVPLIENIYKMIVDKILGYRSDSIQEIKVSGRQEEDKVLATLLNDLLKVFSQSDFFDSEIMKRDKDLIFGMAVAQIWIKQDENKDFHISLQSIPSSSFLIDKFSIEKNASDARRFHKHINLNKDEAKALFKKEVYSNSNESFDNRINLIESWIEEYTELENEEGQKVNKLCFNRYIWNDENQILSYEKSPFKTNSHPFIVQKYQVDEKLKWYGLFRNIKPLQDYINLAENRMMNMMSSTKAFFEESAVLDIEEFIENASFDNAIVRVADGALRENKIQFIQHNQQIAALSSKVNEKRNLAKILSGLNDEALGIASNRQSGIAIAQRRETGLMGLNEYIKNIDEMDKAIFQKALNYIMHYFTKKQIFKIVDKKVGDRYFTINDPQNEESKIKIGKFDLIYKTQLKTQGREERFAHWSEMLKSISQIRPDIIPDLLPIMLKDTDSPVVEDIEEALANAAQRQEEEAKAQQEAAAAMQDLEKLQQDLGIMQIQAQIKELQAKALKYEAQANAAQSVVNANAKLEEAVDINKENLQDKDKLKTQNLQVKGIDLR